MSCQVVPWKDDKPQGSGRFGDAWTRLCGQRSKRHLAPGSKLHTHSHHHSYISPVSLIVPVRIVMVSSRQLEVRTQI